MSKRSKASHSALSAIPFVTWRAVTFLAFTERGRKPFDFLHKVGLVITDY